MVINTVHGTISNSSYADYLVGYISLGDQALLRSGFTFQVMIYSDLPPIEKVDSKTLSRLLSCGDCWSFLTPESIAHSVAALVEPFYVTYKVQEDEIRCLEWSGETGFGASFYLRNGVFEDTIIWFCWSWRLLSVLQLSVLVQVA